MPIVPNGNVKGYGLKGHVFDADIPETMPDFTRSWDRAKRTDYARTETEKMRVVETCKECSAPLTAADALAHKMNHLPSDIRALVRTLMASSVRERVIAAVAELTKGGS